MVMYEQSLHLVAKRFYHLLHKSIREIANMLDISKSTVHRWINDDYCHQRKLRRSKYSVTYFTNIIDRLPTISLRDLIQKYKLSISKSWLAYLFHKAGYVNKKVYTCTSKEPSILQTKRENFLEKIKDIKEDNVISIDETSYYQVINPLKAWVKKGTRYHLPCQKIIGKRYTLITAISNKRLVHQISFEGSCNSKRFLEFLKDMKCDEQFLFLDNVAFHKTKQVLQQYDLMKKTPIFVSPYSPEWNPVEFHFSILKSKLRTRNFDNENIKFPTEHFKKIFTHVFRNIRNLYHR